MSRLNYFERFRDEKFRKLCVDSLPWPDYKEFWPDFAKYMGRKFYNKANKPVSLSLQLFWIDIPKPDSRKDGSIVPVSALPEHTNINTVLFYRYSGADLQ